MDVTLLLKAALLGVVEGATEFLPVSSTGHLIVVGGWLGFTGESAKTFDVVIQFGAVLAVVHTYRKRLWGAAGALRSNSANRRLFLNLAVAFAPAAAVGFFAHGWIKVHLFGPVTVAWALVVGGVAILLIERWATPTPVRSIDEIPPRTAVGIGLAQVLALIPWTSRAGATIMGAYALGCSRQAATEFSFLLAVPVMVAAMALDLWAGHDLLTAADVPVFAVGFAMSFVAALVGVRLFLQFVSGHTFAPFARYRIGFGGALPLFFGA